MRKAVRAIVFKDNNLLVMKRNKFGNEFYTLVGGGIDAGESAEQALLREVMEEAGIEIADLKLVFIEEAGEPFGTQYVYLARYLSGEPALDESSEEMAITKLGQNLYQPVWLPVAELPNIVMLSENLKQAIIKGMSDNFVGDAKTILSGINLGYNS